MRRATVLALSAAVATWTGLVWAADEPKPSDAAKVGGFATSARALSGPATKTDAAPPAAAAATPAAPTPAATTATTSASADHDAAPAEAGTGSETGDAAPAAGGAAATLSAPAAATAKEQATATKPSAVPVSALVPAKQLFGSVKTSAPLQARAIGKYSRGCLAGAVALPVDGPQWQAMRLSRNRNWGHPTLIQTVERLADEAWRYDGWNGLLVGDISQPRGGPMLTGHASHQIGLDADVWLTPMPDRRLSVKEREELNATSMLAADDVSINRKVWTPAHYKIVKRVASYDRVERVLVHPGIKKALCEDATTANDDRSWLHKVRPYWGHYYHFHIRIGCPEGSTNCAHQDPTPSDDGCGKELTDWLKRVTPSAPSPEPSPKPPVIAVPKKPAPPPVTLADLPQECRAVIATGKPGIPKPLLDKQARADKLIAEHAKAIAAAHAAHAKAKEHAHTKASETAKESAKVGATKATVGKAAGANPGAADSAAAKTAATAH